MDCASHRVMRRGLLGDGAAGKDIQEATARSGRDDQLKRQARRHDEKSRGG
jgi:hypothetical protein